MSRLCANLVIAFLFRLTNCSLTLLRFTFSSFHHLFGITLIYTSPTQLYPDHAAQYPARQLTLRILYPNHPI
ncbi:hypothetical protein CONPUDRAFT_85379 [Coniophora puteana RWD-64-598 SS2]|uniref:Secreted protein n=1 Tax=Coniophora puteana (strain RWD-64-598) TaxID=741705 RepID=A0A5M3M900_CONPW|nr:uncharacterized protein CONPUDRAFT_85379 [Coniophora puteana RWD-64-598 SS2]EIW75689.1 hypothetical protein CONPUDRAFT_85379 [Coniophora puteana RWD-64-598 SS2]